MPLVEVHYTDRANVEDVADKLKDVIANFGVINFSVDDRELSEDDFSFKFLPAGKFDTQMHDIIVRVRLHDDETRVMRHQLMTEGLLDDLVGNLELDYIGRRTSVAVEIYLVPVEWASGFTGS